MKKMMITAVAAALAAVPAVAQMQGMDHSGMNHGQMMQPTPANPYPPAEMEMHQKMMSAMGADATETTLCRARRRAHPVGSTRTSI